MSEYHKIAEQISSLLAARQAVDPRLVADVAARYTALTDETRDRLRLCNDYLRRGLRTEAVHLSLCPPDLLEIAPHLQLRDPAQWEQLCTANRVAVSPPFQPEGLENLTNARQIESSLQNLTARHRVLGLARATPALRLQPLRALHKIDPDNPIWPQEIKQFETARIKELQLQAAAAHNTNDTSQLTAISQELESTTWLAPVPDNLRHGVASALAKATRDQAIATLRALAPQLQAAYDARDAEKAQPLLADWQHTVESSSLLVPADLQSAVRPIMEWLATQSRKTVIRDRQQSLAQVVTTSAAPTKTSSKKIRIVAALAVIACLTAIAIYVYLHRR